MVTDQITVEITKSATGNCPMCGEVLDWVVAHLRGRCGNCGGEFDDLMPYVVRLMQLAEGMLIHERAAEVLSKDLRKQIRETLAGIRSLQAFPAEEEEE